MQKKKVIWYFSKIGVWVNFIHSKIEVLQNCSVSLVRGKSKRIERKSNPQIPNPSLLWKWLKHLWTILCFLFEVFLWSGRIYIYSKKSFQPGLFRGLIFRKTEKIKSYFMYSELNLDWEDWDKLISKVLTCQLYLFIIKSRFLNFEHSLKVS
jgi:hypothetical protein